MEELYKLLGLNVNEPLEKVIDKLKAGRDRTKIIEEAKRQLDPKKHDVMDPLIRKKREVKTVSPIKDDNGEDVVRTEYIEVNRVAIAYQRIIVKRAKAFLFGNQPTLSSNTDDEQEKIVLKAIERILFDVKEKTMNRKIADALFSFTEVAEIWYSTESDEAHSSYGFETKLNIRAMVVSAASGDLLYPLFNSLKKLVALSRAYVVTEDGKEVNYFEVYTDKFTYKFKSLTKWEVAENYPIKNVLEKIQAVFAEQFNVEWYEVQDLIDRLNKLLSDHAEVNDRNAYPILAISGDVTGFLEKGPGGGIELSEGADVKYISWDNATDSIKLEIENLIENIHMITQTPNVSMKEVKALGALSGTALKMLFLDAHLKVMEKSEIFDDYLQRRLNIIQAFIGSMAPSLKNAAKNLMVEPVIVPFMVENEKEKIENALLENGNKPLKSHEKSVKEWQGQESEDYERIKSEELEAAKMMYNEPTEF